MALVLVVICLMVALALGLVVWVRHRARQTRLKHAPELKPESLIALSTGAAGAGGDGLPDPKTIAALCAQETGLVQTYQSEALLRDRTISELESKSYISVNWKMEYARPGRYHVLQSTWGTLGYKYDEWVAIGPVLHENVGEWKKMPENTRAEWNDSLRADKFVEILTNQQPRSIDVYRYHGVYYYFLSYDLESLSGFGPFAGFLKGGPYKVRMWIHRTTGLLARVDIASLAGKSEEDAAHPDFEQVFWGYNEAVEIAPPQPPPQISIEESQL